MSKFEIISPISLKMSKGNLCEQYIPLINLGLRVSDKKQGQALKIGVKYLIIAIQEGDYIGLQSK